MSLSIVGTYDFANLTVIGAEETAARVAIGRDDGMVVQVNRANGAAQRTIQCNDQAINLICFTEDGDEIAAICDDGKIVYSTFLTGALQATLDLFTEESDPTCVAHCHNENFNFWLNINGKLCTTNSDSGGPWSCTQTLELCPKGHGCAVMGDFLYATGANAIEDEHYLIKVHIPTLTISVTVVDAVRSFSGICADTVVERLFVVDHSGTGWVYVYQGGFVQIATIEPGHTFEAGVCIDATQLTGFVYGGDSPNIITFNTHNYDVGTTVDIEHAETGGVDISNTELWAGCAMHGRIIKLDSYGDGC